MDTALLPCSFGILVATSQDTRGSACNRRPIGRYPFTLLVLKTATIIESPYELADMKKSRRPRLVPGSRCPSIADDKGKPVTDRKLSWISDDARSTIHPYCWSAVLCSISAASSG
jgi:hypothetical protein